MIRTPTDHVRVGPHLPTVIRTAVGTSPLGCRSGPREEGRRRKRQWPRYGEKQPRVVHVDEAKRIVVLGCDASEPVPGTGQDRSPQALTV